MGALFQVLEIIFEVQRKMNNEKKTSFPTYKTCFFFWTPPTFKPCNILILFKQFKVL